MASPMSMPMRMLLIGLLAATGLSLGQQANPPQAEDSGAGYRISGIVQSRTDAHPLSHARVQITDVRNPQKFQFVITAEDGKFVFDHLPAGKYSLTGAKRGFISASYDQHEQFSTAIVTGAGVETENLALKLAPSAVITGRVLDEAGEPVRHAEVTLYSDNHQEGVDQILPARSAMTDDLGAYEMASLMPGTYFLSARATPWYAISSPSQAAPSEPDASGNSAITIDRSLDVAYPVTYYSDATEADSAAPIPITGGERLQIDFHLNPVPALHLLLRLQGDVKHGYSFPQFEQPTFDGSTFIQPTGTGVVSPGIMEVSGIPAGRYNIRLHGQNASTQMNGVDLTKDGEEIDSSAAEPMGSVKVLVQISGDASIPSKFMVGLRSKGRRFAAVRPVDEKGQAELDQVPPGSYAIFVWGARKFYSVARMSADGAQVVGHTVTVTAGTAASVTLTLVPGNVEVQGVVKRDGKAFSGAMVVLVPKNPEGNLDLFRRDQSDLDGTFSLPEVVPGAYTVLAIENGWDLDWSEPGVIAAYAKHGRLIQVSDSNGKSLNLAEAIELQPK